MRFNQRTNFIILTFVILTVLLAIYVCGLFITEDVLKSSFMDAKKAPSFEHPFGTDTLGRDLFMRTIKGLRISLTIGFCASVISGFIACLVGMSTAIGSKFIDMIVNWLIDLVMSVPHMILVILISFVMGRGLTGLIIGIAATHWCSLARLIRSEVLQLRSQQYVAISRKLGKSNWWIFVNHMLPHLVPQFLVGLILLFPHAILHEAAVSFLGFGLSPEQPAIGIILAESMRYISTGMWWSAVFPGLTLVSMVLLIDKLGETLRVILNPYSAQE